ncbi:hypothetical protein V2J09_001127 [Rumex salicifolius]
MSANSPANYISLSTATTTDGASSSHPFVSRFARQSQTLTHTHRPWRELFSPSSISLPLGYRDAMSRFRRNACYYRYNYSLIVLVVVFLSLLWHPISMIVFIAVFVLWVFLYLSRDDAILLFGLKIDDRLVLLGLSVVTILALVLTSVGLNVLVALIVAFFLIGLHSSFRSCDDQFLNEDEVAGSSGGGGGVGSVSFSGAGQPLSFQTAAFPLEPPISAAASSVILRPPPPPLCFLCQLLILPVLLIPLPPPPLEPSGASDCCFLRHPPGTR